MRYPTTFKYMGYPTTFKYMGYPNTFKYMRYPNTFKYMRYPTTFFSPNQIFFKILNFYFMNTAWLTVVRKNCTVCL